jgi:hypothetical protein
VRSYVSQPEIAARETVFISPRGGNRSLASFRLSAFVTAKRWYDVSMGAVSQRRQWECLMAGVSTIVGMALFVLGLDWIGQGTGAFPLPFDADMFRDMQWAYYGAAMSTLGFAVIWLSRRGVS